jgi:hypothetical protein
VSGSRHREEDREHDGDAAHRVSLAAP